MKGGSQLLACIQAGTWAGQSMMKHGLVQMPAVPHGEKTAKDDTARFARHQAGTLPTSAQPGPKQPGKLSSGTAGRVPPQVNSPGLSRCACPPPARAWARKNHKPQTDNQKSCCDLLNFNLVFTELLLLLPKQKKKQTSLKHEIKDSDTGKDPALGSQGWGASSSLPAPPHLPTLSGFRLLCRPADQPLG